MSGSKFNNPIRRSRNIGTSKQGHGKNNRLVIPERWAENRVYWEKLDNPVAVECEIDTLKYTLLVEPTRNDCFHACTVDDIVKMLSFVPESDLNGVNLIILRQPKRKEEILQPLWGQLSYWVDIGKYSGPAIHLDAQRLDLKSTWPKSITPSDEKELERLENDGHRITQDKRSYIIQSSPGSVRKTQLYRTLLHEIGHYMYFKTHDDKAAQSEKEAYANRYSDELASKLAAEDKIPFSRILDEDRISKAGLSIEWFTAHCDK